METLTLTLLKSKETKNKLVYGTADGTVMMIASSTPPPSIASSS